MVGGGVCPVDAEGSHATDRFSSRYFPSTISATEHHAAAGWPTQVIAPSLGGAPVDAFVSSGADHWYDVGPQKVRVVSSRRRRALGLSMALHEGTEFVEGQVKDTNLDTYSPLRIGHVPEMDISFVDSVETPVGLGEPPTTVVAPAVGNAIFAAVGTRLRYLPIRPADVAPSTRAAELSQ